MEIANTILIITGVTVLLFGFVAFFNPNFARWINAPGGPKLKAIIVFVVGVILVIVSIQSSFQIKEINK
jgi:multisubunit Na+/H+ antiporter MnhG subunit